MPPRDQFQSNTMIDTIASDPSAADGRAVREAAVAPHGLLQAGIHQQQHKSAAQIEREAKETGGPLVALEHKQKDPSGGLVGAIASHERDRRREGGLGATLTERERERRNAEARQREMDQQMMWGVGGQHQHQHQHHRQGSSSSPGGGNPFGMPQLGMPGFGAPQMPGFATGFSMDPVQMQQQMAMLAAQNAYLQAMASFNNPGAGFMGPPQFSPQYQQQQQQQQQQGYGGMGSPSQAGPYQQSFVGQQPAHGRYQSHLPGAGAGGGQGEEQDPVGPPPPQNQSFRTANSYFQS